MPVAGLTLLAPLGLLVCAVALAPLAAFALGARRQRQVVRVLGLRTVGKWQGIGAFALAASACVAMGIAAAQPVLTTTTARSARTSSEVVFVTDVSRSMLASAGPNRSTRLERARAIVARLRAGVPEVPAGISGMTDRALPFIFPTLDQAAFSGTLARSVRIDAPPPTEVSTVATTFEALAGLVNHGFFTAGVDHRTCVLVTDGETRAGTGAGAGLAGSRGCRLVVVRVGSPAERIFRADGTVVASYRPEQTASSSVEQLARAAGGSAFTEHQVPAAAAAVVRAADLGPRDRIGVATTVRALAPYFVVVGCLLAALVLVRSLLGSQGLLRGAHRRQYDRRTRIQPERAS